MADQSDQQAQYGLLIEQSEKPRAEKPMNETGLGVRPHAVALVGEQAPIREEVMAAPETGG
jgi:hypothetical protein